MKKQKKEALYKNQDKQRKLPVIRYYRCNIEKMLDTINIPVIKITTEMLRKYLVEYQTINNCGKVTIDNIRRSLSTFFSWLEEDDYIIKSPMKRIHKVKTAVIVKDTIPDEKIDTTLRYAMVNQIRERTDTCRAMDILSAGA